MDVLGRVRGHWAFGTRPRLSKWGSWRPSRHIKQRQPTTLSRPKSGNVGFHLTPTVQPPKERCVCGWVQRSRSLGSRIADMVVASGTLRKTVTSTKLIAKLLINSCQARCTLGRKTPIPRGESQKKTFFGLVPCHAKNVDKILILFTLGRKTPIPSGKSQKKPFSALCPVMQKELTKS